MHGSTSASRAPTEGTADRGHRWRQLHRIAPLLLLAFGVAAVIGSRRLGLGELTAPGPGLWPFIVSVLLTGTAAVLVFIDSAEDYERWTGGTVRIIAGLVSLGVFILLFQAFGFVVSAFLMLVLWLRVFGGESWRWTLGLAVSGTAVMYLLFVELLGVPFPDGLVDTVIGG
ncbi:MULTISPECIES: tripartite tricarboxylate transporter TctB family protein [unclassified Modestobacter]|uniref:tripartite tricarboxylate transporter TctB family protein n=1 Tax=unclassified Modestobacter TaxID=2643866 RepID=UPI0022AA22C5|nr:MULTISPECIES: tripartite tricarboxylate transporter TctB family protein [unclassified Modestobacter]MCZ2811046.1 tripartite tricarboxylate transporter TctB family protein [Modestobacter sp. VKM Ac-2979]MCZ2840559.1 tripartite tricarboxylate transporter TctB family protein [Modestobacter sp. VKM Ac-2980]MCZ2847846.1 tripartite tricarboxylate transporter TctB family protein [Modestobacter sp. VKM Ac-2978]